MYLFNGAGKRCVKKNSCCTQMQQHALRLPAGWPADWLLRVQLLPALINLNCLATLLLNHRQAALGNRLAVLSIEGIQLKVLAVILVEWRVVFARGEIDHFFRAAVVERTQAHRARACENINFAVGQVFRAQLSAGFTNCEDLRMRGRIAGLRNLIGAFCNHFAIAHNHRGKRAPALFNVFSAPGQRCVVQNP